jgi:Zn-dependent protease
MKMMRRYRWSSKWSRYLSSFRLYEESMTISKTGYSVTVNFDVSSLKHDHIDKHEKSKVYGYLANFGILVVLAGNICSFCFIVVFTLFMVGHLVGVTASGNEDSSSFIVPIIPGITVPLGSVVPYSVCLFIAVFTHELGHAYAAQQENVVVRAVGFVLYLFVPAAYVNIDHLTLNALPLAAQLRIIAAGVTINILSAAFSLGLLQLMPFLFILGGYQYVHAGSIVTGSSVPSVLPIGTKILSVNNVTINSVSDLHLAFSQPTVLASTQIIGSSILGTLSHSFHSQQLDWENLHNRLYAAEGVCTTTFHIDENAEDLQRCCYEPYFHEIDDTQGSTTGFVLPECVLVSKSVKNIVHHGNVSNSLYDVHCADGYRSLWTGNSPGNSAPVAATKYLLRGSDLKQPWVVDSSVAKRTYCTHALDCYASQRHIAGLNSSHTEEGLECVRPVFDVPAVAMHVISDQQSPPFTLFGTAGTIEHTETLTLGKYTIFNMGPVSGSHSFPGSWLPWIYGCFLHYPNKGAEFLHILLQVNLSLAFINSIPIFGMDGQRACAVILRSLPHR